MFVLSIKADCEDSSTPAMCVFSSEITSWRKCVMIRTELSIEFSNSPDNKAVRLPLKFKSILTQYPTCVIN